MKYPIIRLEEIAIENLKNVEYGDIHFDLGKKKQYNASLLGLYGQNGSGKTALINAIDILKSLLMGMQLPESLVDYIHINHGTAKLSFVFSIKFDKDIEASVFYDVELAKEEGRSKTNTSDDIDAIRQVVIVKRERLQYKLTGPDVNIRKCVIADTDAAANIVFLPNSKFELLFGKNTENLTDFLVDKRIAKRESRSFLFSSLFIKRLRDQLSFIENNIEAQYIFGVFMSLVQYGHHDLFVVLTAHSGLNSLNILPLEINVKGDRGGRVGTITLPLDRPALLPVEIVGIIHEIIEMMNLVLSEIIPGLNIGISDLGQELLENGQRGERLVLVSNKNGKSIPLKYESEGIRKIISILSLLIAVYNRPSVTIAIDELDAGIFEYLLGELLRIIAEKGKGQLIFTSHNLRPLETLPKDCIAFTTTNPKKRYIRPINVKSSNNLRDFYYRDITLGEQAEEVYKPTQNSEISYAFKKAGDYEWQKRK